MNTWQQHLKEALSSAAELYAYLGIENIKACSSDAGFPIRVPRVFADKMERGNHQDPLLLQVLSQPEELQIVDGFTQDPLDERGSNPIPGLLHKYHGRVLIVLTGSCAVNCRYCFRRHFSYKDNSALQNWTKILDYLKQDQSINEIILSGGDPLLVDDAQLKKIINDIELIPHISTLRIHTRLLIVIPQRITPQFIGLLKNTRLKTVIVLHSNHANEIDDDLSNRLKELAGVSQLLNQAVLLKGINDSCKALEALSHRLFAARVLPYYLHQLDSVQGAHHFYVPSSRGLELIEQLRARLPGYLVPGYVQEVPSYSSKKPVT